MKTKPPGLSGGHNHENFLTTLKKMLRDQRAPGRSQRPDSPAASQSGGTARHPGNEKKIDIESTGDDASFGSLSLLRDDQVAPTRKNPVAGEFKVLVTLLEKLGMIGSSAEGLTVEEMSGPTEKASDNLAVLKELIAEIQAADLKPGNDMTAGLKRFLQLLSSVLVVDTSAASPDTPKDGLDLNLSQIPGAGGEKPAEHLVATLTAMETENASRQTGSTKGVENSPIPLPAENSEKIDVAKLNAALRETMLNETVKETKDPEKASGSGAFNDDETEMAGKAGHSSRNVHLGRYLSSTDGGRNSGGEPLQENSSTGNSSAVSKLLNDDQVQKENPLKVNIASGDEAGSKVVKIEAASNDGGQPPSPTQHYEKALETVSSAKESEAAQRELRTATMEQIVRRAVIQVRDGHHEARIDLKPDFMGHVRMQVITENHQVTVKILTEFGFVKDMIENNIQQLKADLQQQGLDVDKIDVSVSRDANGNRHRQENTKHARNLHPADKTGDLVDVQEGQRDQPARSGPDSNSLSSVDFFA